MTKADHREIVFSVTAPMFIAAVGYWAFGVPGVVGGLLFVLVITVIPLPCPTHGNDFDID